MINDPGFKVYEYPIGGKMVVGSASINHSYMQLIDSGDKAAKQQVKQQLIHQMAQYILENDLVEFTQTQAFNPNSFDKEIIVRCRAFLAPNDQVKILRTAHKIE